MDDWRPGWGAGSKKRNMEHDDLVPNETNKQVPDPMVAYLIRFRRSAAAIHFSCKGKTLIKEKSRAGYYSSIQSSTFILTFSCSS
jgi:hypothetical protein